MTEVKTPKVENPETSRKERGSNITMPKITWEWATDIMASRWPNTKRAIMVELCIARERGRRDDSDPIVESNPEVKASRSSRKNGR